MRILFTAVPLPGHFFPVVPLAWAFRSLGHAVLVAAPEGFVPLALGSGLPVVSVGPAPDFVDLINAEDDSPVPDRLRGHGAHFGQIAAATLDRLQSVVDSWQPDLVVSERAEFGGRIAAAERGIPFIELHWGVAQLSEYHDGATDTLAGVLADAGLHGLPEPVQQLNPWPPSLRLPYAAGQSSIRHVSFNGTAEVPEWAVHRRRRPRVCLTLGTVVPHLAHQAPGLLPSLVDDLGKIGAEVVVAADDSTARRFPELASRVAYLGHVPLSQVLHTSMMAIHHGGNGTTLTALAAGCPQLVLPRIDDQFENADAVVRSGAGHALRPAEVTAGAVAKECRTVLESVRFEDAATATAAEIAAQPSPVAIAEAILAGLR